MTQHALVEVPATSTDTAIPAWVQTASVTVVLAVAVVALWKIVVKVLTEARQQNKELVEAQTKGMADLRDSVRAMDTANQLGLQRVTDAIGHATARLDRHEVKIDEVGSTLHAHDRRLAVLEGGVVPRATPQE